MASRIALLLAALIAVSQAAPQGQLKDAGSQQTESSAAAPGTNATSPSSGGNSSVQSNSGATSNPGSSSASQPANVAFPDFINLLPSFNFSSSSGSSGDQNPIAAIISIIPNAINTERERIGNAVQQLVSQQVDAAADSINSAAQTGGKFVSDGVKVVASWPAFFGNLLG